MSLQRSSEGNIDHYRLSGEAVCEAVALVASTLMAMRWTHRHFGGMGHQGARQVREKVQASRRMVT
jgi:hypothetical protein